MELEGTVLGYDPGGNGSHGAAFFTFAHGNLTAFDICTFTTANEFIDSALKRSDIVAIGVDTLTCWSTGPSGWRPADRWLKFRYSQITHSIASANSLFGSMGLNGMAVIIALRANNPSIVVCETHPKVLHLELFGSKYNYQECHVEMDNRLSECLRTEIRTRNDHEWDAVISVHTVCEGILGNWTYDLHKLPCKESERVIQPAGDSVYWWPS